MARDVNATRLQRLLEARLRALFEAHGVSLAEAGKRLGAGQWQARFSQKLTRRDCRKTGLTWADLELGLRAVEEPWDRLLRPVLVERDVLLLRRVQKLGEMSAAAADRMCPFVQTRRPDHSVVYQHRAALVRCVDQELLLHGDGETVRLTEAGTALLASADALAAALVPPR